MASVTGVRPLRSAWFTMPISPAAGGARGSGACGAGRIPERCDSHCFKPRSSRCVCALPFSFPEPPPQVYAELLAVPLVDQRGELLPHCFASAGAHGSPACPRVVREGRGPLVLRAELLRRRALAVHERLAELRPERGVQDLVRSQCPRRHKTVGSPELCLLESQIHYL